jgi:deoxyribodipyrimidine photo-lyase
MPQPVNIMWFRRDLRLHDNAALYYALKSENPVVPLFIFDRDILDDLKERRDRRVEFIYKAVEAMHKELVKQKSSFEVYYDKPEEAFRKLLKKYTVQTVFTNIDYEPYATDRDAAIGKLLKEHQAELHHYKDQVILDRDEVLKDDGKPYTMYAPYNKRWKAVLTDFHLKPYPTDKYFKNFFRQKKQEMPTLESMGFEAVNDPFPPDEIDKKVIANYAKTRDLPGDEKSTTRLSVHLRFGTISIRQLMAFAKKESPRFMDELIWREFYAMILWHFPKVGKGQAFKPEYDNIKWRKDDAAFKAWCEGKTGYPLVDAGMRQLNTIGYMHNRARLATSGFLIKHLLLDWRLGEAYFAEKLLDYDLSSNNGNWQWSASSGCDASPFFRIFNPASQAKKFDPRGEYIKRWIPEWGTPDYPQPIVNHEEARQRTLEAYRKALKKS